MLNGEGAAPRSNSVNDGLYRQVAQRHAETDEHDDQRPVDLHQGLPKTILLASLRVSLPVRTPAIASNPMIV